MRGLTRYEQRIAAKLKTNKYSVAELIESGYRKEAVEKVHNILKQVDRPTTYQRPFGEKLYPPGGQVKKKK